MSGFQRIVFKHLAMINNTNCDEYCVSQCREAIPSRLNFQTRFEASAERNVNPANDLRSRVAA